MATTTDCYCRGAGVCEDCDGHTCNGFCTCEVDGAPLTREEVTAGWAPRSTHHETAHQQKEESRA